MEKDLIDFSQLNAFWTVCYNTDCKQKEECLRYQVYLHLPDETSHLCVLPYAIKDSVCPHFKPIRVVRVARGINKLIAEVKEKDRSAIRAELIAYLGSLTSFYRCRRGEKCLYPEQQEWIMNLFRRYGYTDGLVFDQCRDCYDFSE